jgi:hypothetical protein
MTILSFAKGFFENNDGWKWIGDYDQSRLIYHDAAVVSIPADNITLYFEKD